MKSFKKSYDKKKRKRRERWVKKIISRVAFFSSSRDYKYFISSRHARFWCCSPDQLR